MNKMENFQRNFKAVYVASVFSQIHSAFQLFEQGNQFSSICGNGKVL